MDIPNTEGPASLPAGFSREEATMRLVYSTDNMASLHENSINRGICEAIPEESPPSRSRKSFIFEEEPGNEATPLVRQRSIRSGVSSHTKHLDENVQSFSVRMRNRWNIHPLYFRCGVLLAVRMFERIAYYTLNTSQRNVLTHMGFTNAHAASLTASFRVLVNLTPILGGWWADASSGRFAAVSVFLLIYLVGTAIAAVSVYPAFMENSREGSIVLYLSAVMLFVTAGSGGLAANLAAFGGDQFDSNDPQVLRGQQTFFAYFLFAENAGALFGEGYLITLATNGEPPLIPKEYGFFAAYNISAIAVLLAVIVFFLGSSVFVKCPPEGDALQGLFYYLWEGAKKGKKGKVAFVGWCAVAAFIVTTVSISFITDQTYAKPLSWVCIALAVLACGTLTLVHVRNDFLDGVPEHPQSFLSLEEAKATLDTVPVLLLANLAFSLCYNATESPFESQACQMDVRLAGSERQINGGFFHVADCVSIMVFVPFLELWFFPLLEKCCNRPIKGKQRLLAGISVMVMAMGVAAAIEISRRKAPVLSDEPDSNCTPPGVKMSDISAWWMLFPYILSGLSEVLFRPFMYFFSYDQTPPRARSVSQAFNLLAQGALSNGITSCLITALSDFYPEDLNEGRLEIFELLPATFAVLCVPTILYVCSKFRPKAQQEENMSMIGSLDEIRPVRHMSVARIAPAVVVRGIVVPRNTMPIPIEGVRVCTECGVNTRCACRSGMHWYGTV